MKEESNALILCIDADFWGKMKINDFGMGLNSGEKTGWNSLGIVGLE